MYDLIKHQEQVHLLLLQYQRALAASRPQTVICPNECRLVASGPCFEDGARPVFVCEPFIALVPDQGHPHDLMMIPVWKPELRLGYEFMQSSHVCQYSGAVGDVSPESVA